VMCRGGHCSYSCFGAGTYPTGKERSEGMLHPDFERELGRERVVQMRKEVAQDRLEARLAREDRLAKVVSLSEQARLAKARLAKARLAKARLGEEPVLRGGMVARGATFVAALFR
jgi:hypothetical protein